MPNSLEDDLRFSNDMLNKTSRSFAMVIQALHEELRVPWVPSSVKLLTSEDDTTFPKAERVPLLRIFHEKLYQKGWNFSKCGTGDEKILLSNFDRVIHVFSSLNTKYQKVIADITRRMGKGMAEFIEREDWDLYCHYVAGLVGIGLSQLFSASQLEDARLGQEEGLSNSMGLLLQKTNIIRDYREDIDQNRIFWPRAVWSRYAAKLEDFKESAHSQEAVECLNDLITNALHHIPDCIEYMSRLKDPSVFAFCAIPQVMAMATLSLCYANPLVFSSVVKMPRQETEEIISSLHGMKELFGWFLHFLNRIIAKVSPSDPNAQRLMATVQQSRDLIVTKLSKSKL